MPKKIRIGHPRNVRISGDGTNFTLSGTAALLRTTRSLPSLVGNYAITGQDATLSTDSGGGGDENPINEARRIDWTLAGVEGDITHRTNVFTTVTPYTGTAATLNTAIQNCSNAGGGVVQLQTGVYSLSTSVVMRPNVTLRGAGVATEIRFTGTGGTNFQYNGAHPPIYFGPSSITPNFNNPAQTGFPSAQQKVWTGCGGVAGNYPRGATVLNLSTAPTGLTVGNTILLWQTDEDPASNVAVGSPQSTNGSGMPRAGYFTSTKGGTSGNANGVLWQGSNVGGEAHQQRCRVVAINGNDVTIWPGLLHPDGSWKSTLTPMIGWQSSQITGAGVEDLRINANFSSNLNNSWSTVQFFFAANCWITRCLIQPRVAGTGSSTYGGVHIMESRNCTLRSNWIDHSAGGGQGTTTSYGCPIVCGTLHLIENNIFNDVESPLLVHAAALGCVFSYNYEFRINAYEGGTQFHESGIAYLLCEGNKTFKIFGDLFHGVSNFVTSYRCNTFGSDAGFDLQAYHRYHNILGCVIQAPSRYQTTSSDGTLFDRWSGSAYRLGYNGQSNTTNPNFNGAPNIGVSHDPQVAATLFRWGNYTSVDNTTRFSAAECPTGAVGFPNTVPASQTLASSMYRASTPSWFTFNGTTVAWPPIGPDVTGGATVGGRVHKIPAQLAFELAGGTATNFNPSLYG